MSQAVLNVEGMSCNHCKMAVEKALKTLDGVKDAVVDLDSKNVQINFDQSTIGEMDLKKAIEDAGYEVKK